MDQKEELGVEEEEDEEAELIETGCKVRWQKGTRRKETMQGKYKKCFAELSTAAGVVPP